jgi:hypothetical protein
MPDSDIKLLLLNIDAVIDTRQLADAAFLSLSSLTFNKAITLLISPNDASPDTEYRNETYRQTWSRKIEKCLPLTYHLGKRPRKIHALKDLRYSELSDLADSTHPEMLRIFHDQASVPMQDLVTLTLPPEALTSLHSRVDGIRLVSRGPRMLYDDLMRTLGYFEHPGLNEWSCTYADEHPGRQPLLQKAIRHFKESSGKAPDRIFYCTNVPEEIESAPQLLGAEWQVRFRFREMFHTIYLHRLDELQDPMPPTSLVLRCPLGKAELRRFQDYLKFPFEPIDSK